MTTITQSEQSDRRWTDSQSPMKAVKAVFYGLIILLFAIGLASVSGYVTAYQHTQAINSQVQKTAQNTSMIERVCSWHRTRDNELLGKYAKLVALNRAYAKQLPAGYADSMNAILTTYSNDLVKLENNECSITPAAVHP